MELWCVGDDLFSQGMCKAFFSAFESTSDFELQEENKPGNLIVTIPENVGWKKFGKRTKIFYLVEFSTSDDRVFMTSKGWCWHKDYATCANQILKQTKIAARSYHVSGLETHFTMFFTYVQESKLTLATEEVFLIHKPKMTREDSQK